MSAISHDVGDGYVRLRLESPSQLVVNAWLLRDHGRAVLFDAGFTHTTDQLTAGLAELGLTLSDLDAIVYTHTHSDHLGGGVVLHDRMATEHILWEGTHRSFVERFYDVNDAVPDTVDWLRGFLPANADNERLLAEMASIPDGALRCGGRGRIDAPRYVALGERIELAGRMFRCIDARGHDMHHVAWLDEAHDILISGDVVLRVPTPIMPQMQDHLPTWLNTLDRWQQTLDVKRLLPGHGMPTAMFHQAIDRSRLVVEKLYIAAQRCLEDGIPVDPTEIVRAYSGEDRSRYAQRFAVAISTTCSLLIELSRLGLIRRLDDGTWVLVQHLPDWIKLYPQLSALPAPPLVDVTAP